MPSGAWQVAAPGAGGAPSSGGRGWAAAGRALRHGTAAAGTTPTASCLLMLLAANIHFFLVCPGPQLARLLGLGSGAAELRQELVPWLRGSLFQLRLSPSGGLDPASDSTLLQCRRLYEGGAAPCPLLPSATLPRCGPATAC